jgi:hypothetical protein
MVTEPNEELHVPTDPEEQQRIRTRFFRRCVELLPELIEKMEQQDRKAALQQLQHLFERRLSRELTTAELGVLHERFARLGADRLSDVVIDLDRAAFAAWLADPAAS